MVYDVIVIGAGLSGLSAASLLSKSGLKAAVVEQGSSPGGACGIFKREGAIFDQGAAMLYGFGEKGFNAHRFLFNCLEEPFVAVKHELLYVVCYNGKKIHFWPDVERFVEELSEAFPSEKKNIRRFYKDMERMYRHVICETPSYTTPDETNKEEALHSVLKHPVSYLKFLSYMNTSAEKLLRHYFKDPKILHFFDKMTSTYCYTTIEETPAILASVMFIDNHVGGSFYPAGSTLFLPGKLEKVIEENGGEMIYDSAVTQILFEKGNPCGVLTNNGEKLYAKQLIYSGTVWNLYEKLLPAEMITEEEKKWAAAQLPTYPSVVFYALVDASVIPGDACPIEMLAQNPNEIDESEITVYIFSLDDHTLCQEGQHTVAAIGPSFKNWDREDRKNYEKQKQEEKKRLIAQLDRRFPGFEKGIIYSELGTPETIQRYTLKNNGSAAGPKQMLGQHMFLRQHIRSRWDTLYCCGESTTMGTGTPTVTVSGIAAANAVLKQFGKKPYVWKPERKNYVHILKPPVQERWMYDFYAGEDVKIMELAGKCCYCEYPACCKKEILDIPGIMRRVSCGNFIGAKKILKKASKTLPEDFLENCGKKCIRGKECIPTVLSWLLKTEGKPPE